MFGSGSVNTNGVNTEALKDFSGQTKDPHLKKIVDLIAKLFKGELPLGEFIKRMGQVLVEIAFELIEELVKALFDLLIDCIGIIKEFLNAEIRIPILSEIYKK